MSSPAKLAEAPWLKAGVTVRAIVVDLVRVPEVPFTVSMYGPAETLAPTLMVTIDDAVAGFVPNVPVMPAGQPDAASVAAELKPLTGVIVTVDVPVDPTAAVAAVAPRVKLDAALTVSEMVVLAAKLPLVPFTVSV